MLEAKFWNGWTKTFWIHLLWSMAITQVHGDGCFHTGPIPLSLTGKLLIKNSEGWNIEGAQHNDPLKQVAKTISSLAPLAYVSIWRVGKERWKQIINSLLWNDLIRCDQKADCDDQSDEASCQIVYFNPDQYLKVSVFVISQISWSWNILMHQDKPPPPLEIGAKVQILVNVDIKRVLTISEVMRNVICKRHFWYLDKEAYSAFWVETLPKAQRTRELSSYHEFTVHKSWSNYNFRI